VQAEGFDGKLSHAQWVALRYFARANTFSRTPSAFAEFQATTRGTASQTIKTLEAGGHMVRQRSKEDGRSVSLRLTSKEKSVRCRKDDGELLRQRANYSDSIKPAAFGRPEQAFAAPNLFSRTLSPKSDIRAPDRSAICIPPCARARLRC
jgi:DNA-binding MarR family transcriptional regulator